MKNRAPLRPAMQPCENEQTPKEGAYQKELEIDVLARTIWGEARGEGEIGMQAVACVILNRLKISKARGRYWWGDNLIEICQKPYQFSCWNMDDPNRPKLMVVTDEDLYFASALRIARRALITDFDDVTVGATHYHQKDMVPYWAKAMISTTMIGDHIFYRSL